MKPHHRYAIYFAPRAGTALAEFGTRWFGRDVEIADLSEDDLGAIVESPAHYGFHGTLKAPFELHEGCRPDDLLCAVELLAGGQHAIRLPGLSLERLGGFFALVPGAPHPELDLLARNCVTAFDGFRAALGERERARRLEAGLSARQRELLERWGYPYVFDQFRFHMTLTSALDNGTAARIEPALNELVSPSLREAVLIEDICIFGEPGEGGAFELVRRVPFGRRV